MLEINAHLRIPLEEFEWSFVRAGGPGGQNVNKVASKAVLRWPVAASPSLPDEIKARLRAQQHRRITGEGDLVLSSQRYRDQDRNRQDCLDKLRDMILQAAVRPKVRKATRPSRARKRLVCGRKKSGPASRLNAAAGPRTIEFSHYHPRQNVPLLACKQWLKASTACKQAVAQAPGRLNNLAALTGGRPGPP